MAEGEEKEFEPTKKAAKRAHKMEAAGWKSVKTMKMEAAEAAKEMKGAAKQMLAEGARKMEIGVKKMQAGISAFRSEISAFSSEMDKYIGQFYYG